MKYRIFISSVQEEFAADRRVLTECRRPMRMSCPPSRSPSKIEGVPRQRRGSMMSGLDEIKKAADKLGVVVDETFMESD